MEVGGAYEEGDEPVLGVPAPLHACSMSFHHAYTSLLARVRAELDQQIPVRGLGQIINRHCVRRLFQFGNGIELGLEYVISLVIALILLAAGAIGYAVPDSYRSGGVIAEGVVVLLLTLAMATLCIREAYEKEIEVINRIDRVAEEYQSLLNLSDDDSAYQAIDPASPTAPSISLVHAVRNGVLVNVPTNLLIEGDIVQCAAGHTAPGDMRCIDPGALDFRVRRGDIVAPASPPKPISDDPLACSLHQRMRFVMEETPLVADVRAMVRARGQCARPRVEQQLGLIARLVYVWLLPIAVAIALLTNAVRYVVLPAHSGTWLEMFLTLQAYVCIPMLPLVFAGVWHGCSWYGVARVLTLWKVLPSTRPYRMREDLGSVVSTDDAALSRQPARLALADPETCFSVPPQQVWQTFVRIARASDTTTLPRSASLLTTLGAITVLCSIDKEGVLSHPLPSVEKVFLVARAHDDSASSQGESVGTDEDGDDASSVRSTVSYTNAGGHSDRDDSAGVVLDMSFEARTRTGLRFIDMHWDDMLPSLKPLGLNVLLNTSCHAPALAMRLADHVRYLSLCEYGEVVEARKKCLCLLGKAIGFTDNALNAFTRRQQIWTFAVQQQATPQPALPTGLTRAWAPSEREPTANMVSQVVQERGTGALQLLTEGTVPFVLGHCTDVWDGEDVRGLRGQDIKAIMDFYMHMSRRMPCLAFSYRPIASAPDWLDSRHPVALSLPPDYKLAMHADTDTRRQQCVRMQQDQVFIGMVAVQRQPREAIVKMLDELNDAGIRFVFFSPTDATASKAFAEKMGLETGWNCHISLKEDASDVTTEGQSQLPRGIRNIRPHLQTVDDVPLLVPLFTDCSHEATREMMAIMQEHGEVVACLGSALRADAVNSFATADISIGVEPLWPKHCLNVAGAVHFASGTPRLAAEKLPEKDSASRDEISMSDVKTPDSRLLTMSTAFNSAACSLLIGRDTNLYIMVHVMREARRLLHNVRNSLVFVLGCNVSLVVLVVVSYVTLLPPVMTGLQLVWVSVVVTPLLGLGLVASQGEPALMQLMPDKNKDHLKDIRRYLAYFAARFLPIVALTLVLFATTLHALCEASKADTPCNYFGPESADVGERQWTQWSGDLQQGLAVARNTAVSFQVLFYAVTSATFLSRTRPVWQCLGKGQWPGQAVWAGAAVLVVALQVAYAAISISSASGPVAAGMADVPWYTWAVGFGWLAAIVPINEITKRIDTKRYVRLQKRSRLLFGTKLGMHSPV